MKSFISKLEKLSESVVSEIAQMSETAAQNLKIALKGAITNVKSRISSLLRTFAAKVHSLEQKRISTHVGPSTTSFAQRVKSAMKSAEGEAEQMLHKVKAEATDMMNEARNIIHRISSDLKTTRGDITADIRKAGQDVYQILTKIGESAVGKVESFTDGVFKDIEIDGSFAVKHSLKIAEVATISVINPVLVGGIATSAAIIIAAHKYAS
jgi:ElaB/YqjD/DUF883 family membrane-anchored ribosome-binding protein